MIRRLTTCCLAACALLCVPAFADAKTAKRPSANQIYTKQVATGLADVSKRFVAGQMAPFVKLGSPQYLQGVSVYAEAKQCLRERLLRDSGNGSLPRDSRGLHQDVYDLFMGIHLGEALQRKILYRRMDALTQSMGIIKHALDSGGPLTRRDINILSVGYLGLLHARQNIYHRPRGVCELWERWKADGFSVDPVKLRTYEIDDPTLLHLYGSIDLLDQWISDHSGRGSRMDYIFIPAGLFSTLTGFYAFDA